MITQKFRPLTPPTHGTTGSSHLFSMHFHSFLNNTLLCLASNVKAKAIYQCHISTRCHILMVGQKKKQKRALILVLQLSGRRRNTNTTTQAQARGRETLPLRAPISRPVSETRRSAEAIRPASNRPSAASSSDWLTTTLRSDWLRDSEHSFRGGFC